MAIINFDGINDFGGMNYWKVRMLALLAFVAFIILIVFYFSGVFTPPTPNPSSVTTSIITPAIKDTFITLASK